MNEVIVKPKRSRRGYTPEQKKEAIDAYFLKIKDSVPRAVYVTAKEKKVCLASLKAWVAEERRRIKNK